MIKLATSAIHGTGAFATSAIREGTRIVEYNGERISHADSDRREDGTTHTMMFILDENTVIDGSVGGNESAYINHSCSPNCEAIIEDDRVWIYAIRDIDSDEELFIHYDLEIPADASPQDYPCRCGSLICRGTQAGSGSTVSGDA